jgi:MFS family permease
VNGNARNLLVLTAVNSFLGIVMGLIGPFYVLYIKDIAGGMDQLGIAYAIMIFTQAIASYYMGRISDRHGRKPFMIISTYLDAVLLFLYTIISSPTQLFILQAGLGVTNAVVGTTRQALLGDLTVTATRGLEIGKYNAIVGLCSAVGIAAGGILAKAYGLKPIFYIASVAVAFSATLLFAVKENKRH